MSVLLALVETSSRISRARHDDGCLKNGVCELKSVGFLNSNLIFGFGKFGVLFK